MGYLKQTGEYLMKTEQTFEEKVNSGFYSTTALNQMITQYKTQLTAGKILAIHKPETNRKIRLMENYIKSKANFDVNAKQKPREAGSTVETTRKTITLKTTEKQVTHSTEDVSDESVARKYLQVLGSAKERGIEFTLNLTTIRNLLKAKKCYYSGLPFDHTDVEKSLTFDRVDYKKGYVKGNVVACRKSVNDLKNILTEHPASVFKDNVKLLQKVVDKWVLGE